MVISLTEIAYVVDEVYCTIVVTLDVDVANKIIRKMPPQHFNLKIKKQKQF